MENRARSSVPVMALTCAHRASHLPIVYPQVDAGKVDSWHGVVGDEALPLQARPGAGALGVGRSLRHTSPMFVQC
jgi:hypothetical protein